MVIVPDSSARASDICWFCGRWDDRIVAEGSAIGNMVYSSDITASREVFGEYMGAFPNTPEPVSDHLSKDCLRICAKCFQRMRTSVGESPASYVEEHMRRYEIQRSEVADFDGCLITWKDIVYPYGCWLRCFPDIGVRQKFYALDLGNLFERGLRFIGRASFGAEEFQRFLQRFATGESTGTHDFFEHMSHHIVVAGGLPPRELARVRAVVYDVSVFAGGTKQRRKRGQTGSVENLDL